MQDYQKTLNVSFTFLRTVDIIIDPINISHTSLLIIIICFCLPQLDKATVAALCPMQSVDEAGTGLHTVPGCQEVPALYINHHHRYLEIGFRL